MSKSEHIQPERRLGPLSPPFLGAPEEFAHIREMLLQFPDGNVDVNPKTGEAWVSGKRHKFLKPEQNGIFQIFLALINAGGFPLSGVEISKILADLSLDAHPSISISKLRRKLEPEPYRPSLILNVEIDKQLIGYSLGNYTINIINEDGTRQLPPGEETPST